MKYKYILIAAFVVLALASCKKTSWLDINTNPNSSAQLNSRLYVCGGC